MHPKERAYQRMSRRDFLRRAAAAGIAMPGAAAILAACNKGAQTTVGSTGPSGSATAGANPYGTGGIAGAPYPLARLDAPVTWNVQSDNQPIASGLAPEKNATLKIYNWPYYLAPGVWKPFEAKYNCKVQVSIFNDMDQGLAKVNAQQGDFDLLFGLNIWALGRLIAAKLVQPINHDYISNFQANVWQMFQSPFYDVGARYTVPYSVWTTGIFWRNDMIKADIAGMSNPYDIFWNGAPKNKTHLLANSRDVLGLAMLRRGLTDLNTSDPKVIDQAHSDILEVVKATNAHFDHTDYTDVPKGQAWLHQSWSGNVMDAFVFLPKGDTAPNLSYYWPGNTSGVPGMADNDLIVVLKSAKNPVLAHLFIDTVLDAQNAFMNFTTMTGYQMPQNTFTPDRMVGTRVVPQHLASTVLTQPDIGKGYRELELAPSVDALWESAFQQLQAGV